MCEHNHLNYIGEQKRLHGKPSYSLYNCRKCKSTIVSKNPIQQIAHHNQETKWSPFPDLLAGSIKEPLFSILTS